MGREDNAVKRTGLAGICLLLCLSLFAACGEKEPLLDGKSFPVTGGSAMTAGLDRTVRTHMTGEDEAAAVRKTLHTAEEEAYEALLAGKVGLIYVPGPPSAVWEEKAKAMGLSLEATPVARDALVFYVNEKNPVKSVSKEDLKKIYSGEIDSWRALSGESVPVEAYECPEGNFYRLLMEDKIMHGADTAGEPLEVAVNEGEDPLLFSLEASALSYRPASYRNTPGSIFYGGRHYLTGTEKARGIRLLKLEGASPADGEIASGRYDLTYDIYAVILSSSPEGSGERAVVSWLLTGEGQKAVKEAGYAALS